MHQQSHEPTLAALVAALETQGITNRQEQADALHMPLGTYMRRRREEGLGRSKADNSEWIPWTVSTEHHSDPVARNLRMLAQAANGNSTKYRMRRASAIRWARDLVDRNLDVDYTPDQGFYEVPAGPVWLVKRLLDAAMKFLLDLPQLDDLGKDTN